MKIHLKSIVFILCLGFVSMDASVADYQEIYQDEQQKFTHQMQKELKNSVTSSSKKVQELYRAIDYMPVWVDKDYLTQYAELLVHELQEDFKQGLYKELVSTYKQLLPDDNKVFASGSLEDRVKVELGIMQLYVNHINAILKDRKSKYTALSLLQFALKEKSLIHALNAISPERIACRTALVDVNSTILEESEKMDKESLEMLSSHDKKERLNAMYSLIGFKSIWITEAGFSSYTKSLFEQIEDDITFDRNSEAYKSYEKLKNIEVPEGKKEIVAYEFEIAALYQDYMSHLLYGSIDWKAFQAKLKRKRNADWVVHKVLSSPESLLIEAISHQSLEFACQEATPRFHSIFLFYHDC